MPSKITVQISCTFHPKHSLVYLHPLWRILSRLGVSAWIQQFDPEFISSILKPGRADILLLGWYYTCPQSFIKTFSYSFAYNFEGLYWILVGWFSKLSVQTFQSLIVIYRRGCLSLLGMYINFIGHCLIPLDIFRPYFGVSQNQTLLNDVCLCMVIIWSNDLQTTNPLIARPLPGSPNCAC